MPPIQPTDQSLEHRMTAVEATQERQDRMLSEIHAAVVGSATSAGHGEQLRAQDLRIQRLERITFLVVGGSLSTVATGVALAWSLKAFGPTAATPPAVIYVQASPAHR